MDRYNKCDLSIKGIFMYPLEKNYKEFLKGEIAHKRLSEDDMWW